MPRKYFSVDISAVDFCAYYQGAYSVIVAQTEDGQRLQFPAGELRRWVSHTGIQGRFEITFTPDRKLQNLRKVG